MSGIGRGLLGFGQTYRMPTVDIINFHDLRKLEGEATEGEDWAPKIPPGDLQELYEDLTRDTHRYFYREYPRGSGKTTMLARLAIRLISEGKKVAYLGNRISSDWVFEIVANEMIGKMESSNLFRASNQGSLFRFTRAEELPGRCLHYCIIDDMLGYASEVEKFQRPYMKVLEIGSC